MRWGDDDKWVVLVEVEVHSCIFQRRDQEISIMTRESDDSALNNSLRGTCN